MKIKLRSIKRAILIVEIAIILTWVVALATGKGIPYTQGFIIGLLGTLFGVLLVLIEFKIDGNSAGMMAFPIFFFWATIVFLFKLLG